MKKPKIRTEIVIKDQLYLICTKCQKKIVGQAENDLLHNFKMHYEKHERENDN